MIRLIGQICTVGGVKIHKLYKPTFMSMNFFNSSGGGGAAADDESSFHVGHDQAKKQFFIKTQKDGRAFAGVLDYEWVQPGVLNLYHTEVSPALRGQGLAKMLAERALDFAVEQDAKMVLSCSYLAKYVRDNPLPQYVSRIMS